jgi:hypothetical protein
MKWIVACVVLAVLIASALIFSFAKAYFSGDDFHGLVEHHAGRAFAGEVELSPMRWDGSEVFGESLRVRRGEGSEIHARHLRAKWNWRAVFSGAWRLEEVSVESLEGTFGAAVASSNVAPESQAPWFAALLPKRFELGSARIQKADLDFGDIALRGSSLEIRQEFVDWKIAGRGGTLDVPGWPALEVETFRGRLAGAGFAIESSSLRTGEAGNIEAAGSWPGSLDLEWSDVALAELIEARWKNFISGTVSGNAVVDSGGAVGKFRIEDGRFTGAPWLDTLAALTGVRDFQSLAFSLADGNFERRDDVWRLTNLVLDSAGLLRIEGNMEVTADRKLSGALRVGVASKVLRGMPGADGLVFSQGGDGYFWAPVVLGGTLDAPTEDLSERLAAAAGAAVIESVRPALEAVPEKARDAVGETINTLFDILGR